METPGKTGDSTAATSSSNRQSGARSLCANPARFRTPVELGENSEVGAPKERISASKRKATDCLNELLGTVSGAKRKSQLSQLRDLNLYKKIVKTYKPAMWTGCAVTPRDLADFGWECVKKDAVRCVECNECLSTVLPAITDVSINVYNTCLKQVYDKMITSHRPTCKHRVGAPPFRLVDPTPKEVIAGIEERLSDVGNVKGRELISDLPPDVHLPSVGKATPSMVFASALGWRIRKKGRGLVSLQCELCAREVVAKGKLKFDPVRNHERWCPNLDANDNGEPWWRVDLNLVLNAKNKVPNTSAIKEAFMTRRILSNSLSSIISTK